MIKKELANITKKQIIILFWICDYINKRIIVYFIVYIKIYIDMIKKNKKKLLINYLNNLKKQKLLKKKKIKKELFDLIITDTKLI